VGRAARWSPRLATCTNWGEFAGQSAQTRALICRSVLRGRRRRRRRSYGRRGRCRTR
jgi:hypothetical protein